MKMEKTGTIKMEIDHGGLIDALLCKEEPSRWRMPAGAQYEMELQMEMDRVWDERLERMSDVVRKLS